MPISLTKSPRKLNSYMSHFNKFHFTRSFTVKQIFGLFVFLFLVVASAHAQRDLDPCIQQLQTVPSEDGLQQTAKRVKLKDLDKSLNRYWNKSKDSPELKTETIKQGLNKKLNRSNDNAVAYLIVPCDPSCNVGTPSTSNASRCGAGNVNLYASPGFNGTQVIWYSTPTSPGALYTGSPYNAYVSSSRYFYVSTYDPYTLCESSRVPVYVTVTTGPTVYTVSGGGSYCMETPETPPPAVTLSGSQSGVTYRLHKDGTGLGVLQKSGTGSALTWTGSELLGGTIIPGTYTIRATSGSCTADMGTFSLSPLSDLPQEFPVLGGGNYCNGQTVTISLGGAGVENGVRYQLKRNGVNVGTAVFGKLTPISWTGLTEPGVYSVYAYRALCESLNRTFTSTAVVNFTAGPDATITGTTAICPTQPNGQLSAVSNPNYTYQWRKDGVLLGSAQTLPITQAGTYTLTVTESGCSSINTQVVESATLPQNISAVLGLLTNFPNKTNIIEVQGSADATSFEYSVSVTNAGGNVPGRKVYLGGSTVGVQPVTITPYKDGCPGNPFIFNFEVLSELHLLSNPSQNLIGTSGGYFHLPKHENQYSGCLEQLGPVTVTLTFDLGENYNFGKDDFAASATAKIIAYSDHPGQTQEWTQALTISENQPEQIFVKRIEVNPHLVKFIKVELQNYSPTTGAIASNLRLTAAYTEADVVNVNTANVILNPIQLVQNKWEQTFQWNACSDITDYVFQLVRIYDEASAAPPTVEQWQQALTIHTERAQTSLTVSMAEGTGVYWWRVIPLGNKPGGVGNPANWGAPSTPQSFYYQHPEESKNWIYSRTFTEGSQISEQVTYANGLQQILQQQTRVQDDNHIVASQTIQDYIGRNALTTLPIPTGINSLGYISNVLKNGNNDPYRVEDFDRDATIRTPVPAFDYSDYYSGNGTTNTFNSGVPGAGGYPYTRTFFAPDGRVREQTGVGSTHSVTGGKTVKTYYSNPSEGELVRLFGSEAPLATAVQKITTVDANGTASISYQTKDGNVIATALEVGVTAGPLTALPSAATATTTFTEQITGFERPDNKTIMSSKPLFFVKPTTVTVDYKIAPALLNDLCNGVSTNTLAASYLFNGNANDQSGNGHDATLLGGVTLAQDANGEMSAYRLNGSTGYLQVNDRPELDFGSDDFTVSFWVKRLDNTSNWDNSGGVAKWNNGNSPGTNEWSLSLKSSTADNNPVFSVENGTTLYRVVAGTSMLVNQWYHLVGVKNGTQLQIYVNGALSNSLTIPSNLSVNNISGRNLWVGRVSSYYTYADFDDIQLYRKGLTSEEVSLLYNRQSICKTCDYKVELLLSNDDNGQVTTLASSMIQAGECSQLSSKVWDPAPLNVPLVGGTKYTLQKRITIENADSEGIKYLDTHAQEMEDSYRTALVSDPHVVQINQFINQGNLQGLQDYLQPYFDADQQQYVLPVGTSAGCPEFIYIPVFEVCPDEVSYANCQRNGETYWQYLVSYYNNTGVDVSQALFFINKINNTKLYFNQAQFDQMVANMISDNGLACEDVWRVWEREVAAYEAGINQDLDVDAGDMDGEGDDYADDLNFFSSVTSQSYSLLESFLKAMDGELQEDMPVPSNPNEAANICAPRSAGNYYFIKRAELYGKFSSTVSILPDRTLAYKLVYYDYTNKGHTQALKFYRGAYTNEEMANENFLPVVPADFTALADCDKYKYSKNTEYQGQQMTEADVLESLEKVRSKCAQGCEGRAEEFRQAIIHKIMEQNPSAVIEHYNTYIDPVTGNIWVGVQDTTLNKNGYTLSKCELEAMVDALVQNCISNYCNTTLTPIDTLDSLTNRPVRVYGTVEERLKIEKAFRYDFELKINESCGSGWDYIEHEPLTTNIIPLLGFEGWIGNTAWSFRMDKQGDFYIFIHNDYYPFVINGDVHHPLDGRKYIIKFDQNGVFKWKRSFYRSQMTSEPVDYNFKPNFTGGVNFGFNYNSSGITYSAYDINFQSSIIAKLTQVDLLSNYVGRITGSGEVAWIDERLAYSTFNSGMANDNNNNLYYVSLSSAEALNQTLSKVSPTGNIVYSVSAPFSFSKTGSGQVEQPQITVDDQGNLYYAVKVHSMSGTVNVNVDGVLWTSVTGSNKSIWLFAKLNSNGDVQWRREFRSVNSDFIPSTIRLYGMCNSLFIQSSYNDFFLNGSVQSLPNGQNGFVQLDNNGDVEWSGAFAIPNIAAFKRTSTELSFLEFSISGQESIVKFNCGSKSVSFEDFETPSFSSGLLMGSQEGNEIKIIAYTSDQSAGIHFGPTYPYTVFLYREGSSCGHAPLCFRFTNPKPSEVVVPAELEDYVYNPQPIECTETLGGYLQGDLQQQLEQMINTRLATYRNQYYQQCGDPARIKDKLTVTYQTGIHHFTLYYYDRAGNLIRTVPPQGVQLLPVNTETALANSKLAMPAHTMVTEYQYNSLGQLVREHSPDGTPKPHNGTQRPASTLTPLQVDNDTYYSSFIYTSIGQLRFSRNAQQKTDNKYSYTKYDELGRVIEVGEATGFDYNVLYLARDEQGTSAYPTTNTSQVTRTFYTEAFPGTLPPTYTQRNLRNRVSYTYLDEDPQQGGDETFTVYSYDPHGNVEWLAQLIPGLEARIIKYEYDLISGKVTRVNYSPGQPDQFYHKYAYDASNRIKTVFTSTDGELWQRDARYQYYLHGPLKRAVIGEDEVQGIDYTYTIHGWLKAVNHQLLNITTDPAQDGAAQSQTARDAFGMALGYYAGDYQRTGSPLDASHTSTLNPAAGKSLYNGNIGSWASNILYPATATGNHRTLTGYQYTYDELNRLLTASFRVGASYTSNNEYYASYTYLANGNINGALVRAAGGSYSMDNLTYNYQAGTNRLRHVTDAFTTTPTALDVENQPVDNYQYDAIGNLVRDNQQLTTISWTPYGKVKQVNKDNGTYTKFMYDAAGNRVRKIQTNTSGLITTHYYVRDASGNIMAVYRSVSDTPGEIRLSEIPIYGSDRLGRYTLNIPITSPPAGGTPGLFTRKLGDRQYELKDHLGNVRVVLTDVKLSTLTGNTPGTFRPEVTGTYNYYPFGMDQPGRTWGEKYRYGFNGKEKDDNGEWGNTAYDYGFRIYNPSIGRFLSVDPLTKSYPMLTPYQFASNRPIDGVDLDGLEYETYRVTFDQYGSIKKIAKIEDFTNMTDILIKEIHGVSGEDFYKENSQSFGPEGRGVKYIYSQEYGFGERDLFTMWEVRQNGDSHFRHGRYYGAGSVTLFGPLFPQGEGNPYDYNKGPIDEVDAIARIHDLYYDFPGYTNYMDPRTWEFDQIMVQDLNDYLERASKPGYIDKYSGKPPSKEAIKAAKDARVFIGALKSKKILQIIDQGISDQMSKEINKIYEYHAEKNFDKFMKFRNELKGNNKSTIKSDKVNPRMRR